MALIKSSEKKNVKVGIVAVCIIVVLVLAAGGIYYMATADERSYKSAQELYESEQYEEALQIFEEIGAYKDSEEKAGQCRRELSYRSANELYANQQYKEALQIFEEIEGYKDSEEKAEQCRYELSVNGQFMRKLSEGLEKRWDKSDEYEKQGIVGEDPDAFYEYCEIELAEIESFYDQTFEDPQLQENARLYIDVLRAAKEATKHYTIDYQTFYLQWTETYAQRTVFLEKFVDEYGLEVDDKYQKILNSLLVDASAVKEQDEIKNTIQEMTEGFSIDMTEDGWGIKSYKINMKNTTNRTFEYFYVNISVYDSEGKIIAGGFSSQVESWKPEQEARVDVFFDADISLEDCVLEYIPHYQSGSYYE